MQPQTMRQLARACSIIAVGVFFVTIAIVVLGWLGFSATSLKLAAAGTMVLTLVLQFAFVVAQLFPAGRIPIPFKHLGRDSWLFVIVATGVPGMFWGNLASFAGRPLDLIMPGMVTPLINSVLFMFARMVQQRGYRDLIDDSAPPAA